MILLDKLLTNPIVSVIVTSYNQVDTLPQTLDSILAQQCVYPFEMLIGDDCSTDNTREVREKLHKML